MSKSYVEVSCSYEEFTVQRANQAMIEASAYEERGHAVDAIRRYVAAASGYLISVVEHNHDYAESVRKSDVNFIKDEMSNPYIDIDKVLAVVSRRFRNTIPDDAMTTIKRAIVAYGLAISGSEVREKDLEDVKQAAIMTKTLSQLAL